MLLYLHQGKTVLCNGCLFVHYKNSKTEFLIFDSHKRSSKNDTVDITMNWKKFSETENYKYLGVTLDKNLNLQSHFDKIHMKMASRIKLLERIRVDITPAVIETIYKVMILPIFLFCCTI